MMATDSSTATGTTSLTKSKTNYYTELNEVDLNSDDHNSDGLCTDDMTALSALETATKSRASRKQSHASILSNAVEDFLFQSKASLFSSGVNICNANVGAGLLGLPFAVRESGWLMGIVLFIVFALMSIFSFNLLMTVGRCYCNRHRVSSWAIVVHDVAPKLQFVIDFFIAFGYTLTNTAYLIIIGDYLPLVAQEIGDFDSDSDSIWVSRSFWIFSFLFLFIIPTTAFKRLDALRFSSMVAICCFIYVVLMVILYAIWPGDRFEIDESESGEINVFPTSPLNFFDSAPLYVFAYGGHPLAFIVTNEMIHPSLHRIAILNFSSFGFVTVVYATVALFGYFTFGDNVRSNILLNYPNDDSLIIAVRIGISVAVAFSYPVLANPWKQSMASLLFRVDKQGKDATDLEWYKYYGLVALLVTLTAVIAMYTDDLGNVSKLQGATAGTFMQICAPGIIYYYYDKVRPQDLRDDPMYRLKWRGAVCLIVFGLLFIPLATTMVFV